MDNKKTQEALILAVVSDYVKETGDKNPDEKKLQNYIKQKGGDKYLQLKLQSLTQKAAHGTKLQYIKNLKNQCADDEELVYFKKGGSLGCGCVKKGTEGMEFNNPKNKLNTKPTWTKEDDKKLLEERRKGIKNGPAQKKWNNLPPEEKKKYQLEEGKKGIKINCVGSALKLKKIKCGTKMKKHEQGGSLNGVPFYQDGGKNKKSINDYYLTDYSEPNILRKVKLNGKELTIKVNKGLQKGEDPITIQGNNYYLKGDSTLVKDNSIPYSFLQLRNAGINKKYNGGSLNQIPFYLAGTPKNGIRVLYKDYPKTLGSVNLKEVRYPDGSIIQLNVTYKPNLNDTTIRVFGPKTKLLYEKSNYDIKNNNQRLIFDKKKRGFNLAWKQAGNRSIEPFIW